MKTQWMASLALAFLLAAAGLGYLTQNSRARADSGSVLAADLPVARVNGETVTLIALETARLSVLRQNPSLPLDEQYQAALEQLVEVVVVRREAKRRGLGVLPEPAAQEAPAPVHPAEAVQQAAAAQGIAAELPVLKRAQAQARQDAALREMLLKALQAEAPEGADPQEYAREALSALLRQADVTLLRENLPARAGALHFP